MKKTFKIGHKNYTLVSYAKIREELTKFEKYASELDNTMPDYCSEVWQVADNMIRTLQGIRNRAIRLEKEHNNK